MSRRKNWPSLWPENWDFLWNRCWRSGGTQGLCDAGARRDNVRGVYRIREGAQVAGKRFLLVDDVLTTGSTLSECARVLREAGAREVYGAAFARTFAKRPGEKTGKGV